MIAAQSSEAAKKYENSLFNNDWNGPFKCISQQWVERTSQESKPFAIFEILLQFYNLCSGHLGL